MTREVDWNRYERCVRCGAKPGNACKSVRVGADERRGLRDPHRERHIRPELLPPRCPHDNAQLRWAEDAWICPKCSDEWSTDVFPIEETS